MSGKLMRRYFVRGEIEAVTGIHIGGNDVGLGIGGADKVVIRHPVTKRPYIPGTSLRGKMRSLLEKLEGKFGDRNMGNVQHGPCQCGECVPCKIFGTASNEQDKKFASRLIVRDGRLLNPEYFDKARNDVPYGEIKTEVVIDRITSAAMPRQLERVPAGARFVLDLVLNEYEGDAPDGKNRYLGRVLEALTLVQDDYLGGQGARGYGQIKIKVAAIEVKDKKTYEDNAPAAASGIAIPAALMAS